ncbi:hypothetical protein RSAG8_11231, partial [Rhizoctonia solani AG-8 WAC10335]
MQSSRLCKRSHQQLVCATQSSSHYRRLGSIHYPIPSLPVTFPALQSLSIPQNSRVLTLGDFSWFALPGALSLPR